MSDDNSSKKSSSSTADVDKNKYAVDDIKKVMAPKFTWRFLLPKYWLLWLGALILYLIVWLPYPLIKLLGKAVGRLIASLLPKRARIAKTNIRIVYPEWSEEKVEQVYRANLDRSGTALFETAIGWWWPSWRIKRRCKVIGFDKVQKALDSGKGAFVLALHNVNLEFACRVLGYKHPSVAFYRKHDNPLLDYWQYHGRNRSNRYMVDKRSSDTFIKALKNGELGIYLPDQDYGLRQSIFVPFGGVEKTATTVATLMFARRSRAAVFIVAPRYTDTGCDVEFTTEVDYLADMKREEALTKLNQDLYDAIAAQPENYLWMHKRFKTRPEDEPASYYDN